MGNNTQGKEFLDEKVQADGDVTKVLASAMLQNHPDAIYLIVRLTRIASRLSMFLLYCVKQRHLPLGNLCLHYLMCMAQVELKGTAMTARTELSGSRYTTHQRILGAAQRAILEGRSPTMTMTMLAKEAPCTQASVERYFGSFTNLFVAAYSGLADRSTQ